jgi:hypothetical protein
VFRGRDDVVAVEFVEGFVKLTASQLVNAACLSAVVAGLLFVGIQVVHPPDEIGSVTTSTWMIVHSVSITMSILWVIGLGGIYARQFHKTGWLGLIALIVMSLALLLTAALTVVEAYVVPQLVASSPAYVEGFLGLVSGHPSTVDLGAIPTLWAAHDALFLIGTVSFGIVTLWAGVLPRPAAALFAFGLFLVAPAVAAVGSPRLAAVPVGLGLAWLGYAAWSRRREAVGAPLVDAAPSRVEQAASA